MGQYGTVIPSLGGTIQNSLSVGTYKTFYLKQDVLLLFFHNSNSGLALSFGIRSKSLTVREIWHFKVFEMRKKFPDLAKLMTWGDSHWGAVHLKPNSRLPGRHSKEHCSHKNGDNMTWIGSLFFLNIMTHMFAFFYTFHMTLVVFFAHFLAQHLQKYSFVNARKTTFRMFAIKSPRMIPFRTFT